ncbi:bifunctional aminoglycoside phosphotransferase/ATP-binding protein [Rhodoferax sp.]|uniref:bifunctional aminoglycoside phosphotransferase/ATP-binding protein n=1 Tax=Rhodoferax sp. TaxID=50421 RepID=UPI00262DD3D1|nr:bifunctional aminoglycoside phosphotransferase/ATP-binding protein [Rhodoferax sp.]MDD2917770.1 AAA family ATPase [Rhodoferax sp.]
MMTTMDADLPRVIDALLDPARYPGDVRRVELVQTHISWVLLAGDFAYKIKKPVKLSFLDFSTLALRHRYCLDELRLNRRFAPDLYLDVVGIFNTPQDPQWQGSGAPIEYAVKMHRFEESSRLDHVCARGELQAAHLSALADAVVAFHQAAAVAPNGSYFGSGQHILQPALDNFTDLLRFLPEAGLQNRLVALRHWTQAQFDQLAPLMQARQQAGRVRECHGDLHLANMVLIDGRVQLFDCIEFNEDLRWIDVASEIAFVYIDLLEHQQPGLADWLLDEVLSRSGDYEAARVLRFYAVYRAMVRAKVAALRRVQIQGDTDEVEAYVALAERLLAPPPARLVITHGLSGCGKTVASDALLQTDPHASTLRLRSDVQRKRLFGLAPGAASGSGVGAGIYAFEAHERTYAHLREQAALLLQAGWSVVVDAAFLKRADRDAFRLLAQQMGADFSILAPQASPEQLRQRILARSAAGHDASEATMAVLAQQMQVIEPLGPDEIGSTSDSDAL